jgi:hypothetical protein
VRRTEPENKIKKIKKLIVLLFKLNILILLREWLEKHSCRSPGSCQPPSPPMGEREIMPIAPLLYRI